MEGVDAEIVTHKTPREERKAIIDRFRSGDLQILCSVDALSIGFDVPTGEGSTKPVAGKFVDIYKRGDDGAWKIRLTIYNMDEPVPG